MASCDQVRGMLLEEVILHLLAKSGYRTVDEPGSDPTLCSSSAGLTVRGRGTNHQIDAIADFLLSPPFSYPQRLLVEAKHRNRRTGLDVVRNALGVWRDVSEYWPSRPVSPVQAPAAGKKRRRPVPKPRYHYQYAVFSASEFSGKAQNFAYAQDIYLFPLAKCVALRPVLERITRAAEAFAQPSGLPEGEGALTSLRKRFRGMLREQGAPLPPPTPDMNAQAVLQELEERCRMFDGALLANLGGQFPVFLVPSEGIRLRDLHGTIEVRVRYDDQGWHIWRRVGAGDREERLFSFDLPDQLFEKCAEGGRLSPMQALNMKQEYMNEFYAVRSSGSELHVILFRLDGAWVQEVRDGIRRHRSST